MRFNTIGVNYDTLEQAEVEKTRIMENYGLTICDELLEDESFYVEYDISNCTSEDLIEIFKNID